MVAHIVNQAKVRTLSKVKKKWFEDQLRERRLKSAPRIMAKLEDIVVEDR